MAIMIILVFTMFLMLGALVYSYGNGGTSNGVHYLGITLPQGFRKEEAVGAIAGKYKRDRRKVTLIGFVSCFLVIPMWEYISAMLVYMMVWFFVLNFFYAQNLKKAGWEQDKRMSK